MYKGIDLHLHTTASDGSDSPRELIDKAKEKGLDVISITDHDTIAGSLEAISLPYNGVKVITGIEFSCKTEGCDGFECHILGYGFDPEHPALLSAIDHGRQMRLYKLELRLVYLFGNDNLDIRYLHFSSKHISFNSIIIFITIIIFKILLNISSK